MTLLELYKEVKDLKMEGNVIVPFRKSEYHICRIGQFSVIPDMTIDITESDNHEAISVNDFVEIINKAIVRGRRGALEYAQVELYYEGKDNIYGLSGVYAMDEKLYLIIG